MNKNIEEIFEEKLTLNELENVAGGRLSEWLSEMARKAKEVATAIVNDQNVTQDQ